MACLREAKNMDAISKQAQCNIPCLRVLLTIVNGEDGRVKIELRGRLETQPTKLKIALILDRIKSDQHSTDCMYKKVLRQSRSGRLSGPTRALKPSDDWTDGCLGINSDAGRCTWRTRLWQIGLD